MRISTRIGMVLGGFLAFVVASCGGPVRNDVSVKGRLTENGAAVMVPDDLPPGTRPVVVCFYLLTEDGQTGEPNYATLEADGSFTVAGPQGKGIPTGKYRVSVEAAGKGTGKGAGAPKTGPPTSGNLMGIPDKFQGALGRERSPFKIEITGPSEVQIEVGTTPKIAVQ